MGINNFCKLLEPFKCSASEPRYFDSVLIDLQGWIYSGIQDAFRTQSTEDILYDEICRYVWQRCEKTLNHLFSFPSAVSSRQVTLVLSYDGRGIPMKWPVQRDRRQKTPWSGLKDKTFYSHVLFGANVISNKVHLYLDDRIKEYALEVHARPMRVVCLGCQVAGEGEHKLFQLAHSPKYRARCRNPMVVSVDQDVFMIACLRLDQFDSVQVFRYQRFYPVTELFRSRMPYPFRRFATVSFLFGNDFFPEIVSIKDTNPAKLLDALRYRKRDKDGHDDDDHDPPRTLSRFLTRFSKHLHFKKLKTINPLIPRTFWINYFWMTDYYRQRKFPQLYMKNELFRVFNRDQLLTALMDRGQSTERYKEALFEYEGLETDEPGRGAEQVFTDSQIVDLLRPYWLPPVESECHVIDISEEELRAPT